MKIWVRNKWYTLPNELLVVYLEDKDKENIKNMHPDCNLYCEFDDKIFHPNTIIELLKKLKKEAEL